MPPVLRERVSDSPYMLPVADVVKSRRRENVRGEPSVGSLEDAFRCFMGTELDVLAVGNCYLRKEREDPALKQNYESAFELD